MVISKLTSRGRTTIPFPVPAALGATEGDALPGVIADGGVMLAKSPPHRTRRGGPFDDPFSIRWKWDTKEGDEAFADP